MCNRFFETDFIWAIRNENRKKIKPSCYQHFDRSFSRNRSFKITISFPLKSLTKKNKEVISTICFELRISRKEWFLQTLLSK